MANSSKKRVLLVEDEWEIADFVVRGLREEGFHVEHAPDGLMGMHQIDAQAWDVILLDWGLPGENGMALLKRLRSRGMETPVIFLTARDSVPDRVKGLNAGADDYLCKPFAFEELLARIRGLIRRAKGEADPSG
jgi:DNA-binding response OmpR family regulator